MKIIQAIHRRFKAQSTLELSALLIITLGALLAIQVYFKRGIQGRWKQSVDDISEELYDPFLSDSNLTYRVEMNTSTDVKTVEDVTGRWTMRTDVTNSIDRREGYHRVGGYR